MSIPKNILDEIRNKSDIVKVIGEYIPLRQAGRSFKALCPFHNEKTPSFVVSVDKQIFRCFGCGTGGNVFTFVSEYKKISFEEAVRELADKVGIRIPDSKYADEKRREYSDMTAFLDRASDFYFRCLAGEKGKKTVTEYLRSRKLDDKTIGEFGIGYAPAEGDALYSRVKGGFADSFLYNTGLFVRGKSGTRDIFRDRVIFPIKNDYGKVAGFAGRALSDEVMPKYINSPDTRLYKKSRILYAMDLAKRPVIDAGYIIIVEGYMDAIFMHKHGYRNTAATCGTALTPDHCALIKKFTDQVVLMFDPDKAGLDASLRSIGVLFDSDILPDVLVLPEPVDIDEFLEQFGKARFEQALKKKKSCMDFMLDYYGNKNGTAALNERIKTAKDIFLYLSRLKSPIAFEGMLRIMSERLDIREQSLLSEFRKVPQYRQIGGNLPSELTESGANPSEDLIAGLLLNYPENISAVKGMIETKEMKSARAAKVLDFLFLNPHLKKNEALQKSLDSFEEKEMKNWISSLAMDSTVIVPDPGRAMEVIADALKKTRNRSEHLRLNDISERVKKMLDGKEKKDSAVIAEYSALLKKLKK